MDKFVKMRCSHYVSSFIGMKSVRNLKIALVFLLCTSLWACKKEPEKVPDDLPPDSLYKIEIPFGFPPLRYPDDNKPTESRIALGRKLYYDPILSNDGRSCASCHIQSKGFSLGVVGKTNVLPHINLGWKNQFLWNGKIKGTLEDVMLFEVNEFFATDLGKLNNHEGYRKLFKDAYGVKIITDREVAYALAQFFRTLNSGNSKFDLYAQRKVNLTPSEYRGLYIFFSEKGDCFHCHSEIFFTTNLFSNNGLDSAHEAGNLGLYETTGNPADKGKFKIPTLRNVAVRSPYMHDGRFSTLDEVIEFYHAGVQINSPNIDSIMITPDKIYGKRFSAQDKLDLTNFLHTLTDTAFLNNPALSRPD